MSPVALHLALNHLPVAGFLFAVGLLAIALITKSRDLKLGALLVVLISSLLAIPVYLTGEGTEESLERLGVSEAVMERHEEMAEITFIAVEIVGVGALIALVLAWRYARLQRAATAAILLLSLVAAGMVGWTAKLGGEIRHGAELGVAQPSATVYDEDDD